MLHPDPDNQPYQFQVGMAVMIVGLRKKPEFNKARGIIKDFDPLMLRWLVAIGAKGVEDEDPDDLLWVRQDNLSCQSGGTVPDNHLVII